MPYKKISVKTAVQIVPRMKNFEDRMLNKYGLGESGDVFLPLRKFAARVTAFITMFERYSWRLLPTAQDEQLHEDMYKCYGGTQSYIYCLGL